MTQRGLSPLGAVDSRENNLPSSKPFQVGRCAKALTNDRLRWTVLMFVAGRGFFLS
jgi:TRAP-type C4-dicarboxylate transport system substrate-binding protein